MYIKTKDEIFQLHDNDTVKIHEYENSFYVSVDNPDVGIRYIIVDEVSKEDAEAVLDLVFEFIEKKAETMRVDKWKK